MPDNIRMEIEGLDEVVDALRKIGADVTAAVEQIALAAAEPAAQAVAAKAPGKIGEAIVKETTEKSQKVVTVSVGPSTKAWFARFFESGTVPHVVTRKHATSLKLFGLGDDVYRRNMSHPGMPKRPFMAPAFDESEQEAEKAAAAAGAKAIGID